MSCDILVNPSLKQINDDSEKMDAIMVLHSIDQDEITNIIDYYEENKEFNIVYIHKYTEVKLETVFGMKRCF